MEDPSAHPCHSKAVPRKELQKIRNYDKVVTNGRAKGIVYICRLFLYTYELGINLLILFLFVYNFVKTIQPGEIHSEEPGRVMFTKFPHIPNSL